MSPSGNSPERYDVIVVGAGPAGCEAAVSAANLGAKTLCLTINLDSIALHPAGPVLADGKDDPRSALLQELRATGGVLPEILMREGTTADVPEKGRVLIDRRRVSLAYKARLEHTEGVELRQGLVVSLEPQDGYWVVRTKLEEAFSASCVIVAAGTYLNGTVTEAGVSVPGGRHGEIPSNGLAACLAALGINLEPANATCFARVAAGSAGGAGLPPDGEALRELYALGIELDGSRAHALQIIRSSPGCGKPPAATAAPGGLTRAWITRSQFTVRHLILSADQVGRDLQSRPHPELFFAGRAAGSCNYAEAAALGMFAGDNAAVRAKCLAGGRLIKDQKIIKKLVAAIAEQQARPVTIRKPPPGC